ncbi:MAG: hypothetical protein HYZ94_02700 [Candidatus Omnitrophica bacterium]|nr:hypothetical protein [Candidatus Omnitrophota bacterium]
MIDSSRKMGCGRVVRELTASLLALALTFVGVPVSIPPQVLERLPDPLKEAAELVEMFRLPEAAAAQIKRVQKGMVSFDANDLNKVATLTYAVDQTKSLVLIAVKEAFVTTTGDRDQNHFITAQFEDNSTLSFDKGNGTQATDVFWHVVEFEDGVKVQRGISSMTEAVKLKYIQIPQTIDRTKAIPFFNVRGFITTRVDTEILTLLGDFYASGVNPNDASDDVTSSDYLRIQRLRSATEAGITRTINIVWQVIEFLEDATVKTGTVDIAYNQLSATVDITATPIADLTKTSLFLNYAGGNQLNGVDETLVPRGTITDANTLTFNRVEHGTQTNDYTRINWYLLELTDSSSLVQRGSGFSMASGAAAPQTATIGSAQGLTSAVDVDRSFALIYPTAGTDNTTYSNDVMDDIGTTAELTGTQTLTLTRGVSGTAGFAATIDWGVTEFTPVTIKVPNGNEVWDVGQVKNIVWKHADSLLSGGTGAGGVHLGKIEASVNSGGAYIGTAIVTGRDLTADVGAAVDNEGSYAWTIPATLGGTELDVKTVRIKVTDTDMTARNFDVSNADFEIRGVLTLTAPNTGVTWKVAETTNDVTWSSNANLDNNGNGKIRLELWRSSGTVYDSDITTSLTDVTASTGLYDWTIPDNIRADLRVKAKLMLNGTTAYTSLDSTEINDFSNVDFTIAPQLTLTAHNGGSPDWPTQTSQNVTWTFTGTWPGTNPVSLSYSTNGGGAFSAPFATPTAAGSPGSYPWTVPAAAISDNVILKVSAAPAAGVAVEDVSNAVFKILPSLNILTLTPVGTGNSPWQVGQQATIDWQIAGSIADVKLEYSTDGFADELETYEIVASTPADNGTPGDGLGSYPWPSVDNRIDAEVRIRISKVGDATVNDYNGASGAGSGLDQIKIRGKITVIAPNGTEKDAGALRVNTAQIPSSFDVSWNRTGSFGNVDLHYKTSGAFGDGVGVGDGAITTDLNVVGPTPHSFPWPVPNAVSQTVRVRVRATGYNADTWDESDADFHIKGQIDVTDPDGSEILDSGVAGTITWNWAGSFSTVKVEYTADGTNWNELIPSTDNDGSFPWTPTIVDNRYLVRVTQTNDPYVTDPSAAPFEVKGSITNTLPDGNADPALTEYWRVGQAKNITWTVSPDTGGGVGQVKLLYSTDGGTNFPDPANRIPDGSTTVASTDESYLWTIPAAAQGESIRLRVHKDGDLNTKDDTNNNIRVYDLVLTYPGATDIRVGGNYTFGWTKTGAFSTPSSEFRVMFSKEGAAYTELTNPVSRPTGVTWQWANVPASARTTDAKFRLEWMGDTTDFSVPVTPAAVTIKPTVDLTAPDGNTTEGAGTQIPITFIHTGTTGDSWRLLYSTNGGDAGGGTYPNPANVIDTVTNVTPNVSYQYDWTIPSLTSILSNTVKVKVELVGDEANVKNESANNFAIKGSVTGVGPNGNADPVLTEYWRVGQTKSVTWNSSPDDQGDVTVVYSKDAGANFVEPDDVIGTLNSALETKSWAIPVAAASEQVRFRVYRTADSGVKGDTTQNVKIYNLTMTTPGLADLRIGNNYTFNWAKTGLFAAPPNGPGNEFKLYVDIGTGYQEITSGSLPTGTSWQWTNIPASKRSDTVKVKVEWQGDAADFGVESGNFTIKPKVDLTAPDGNTTEGAGTQIPIVFTHTGTTSDSWKLLYSINGGDAGGGTYPDPANVIDTVTSVAPSVPYQYDWTLPSVPSILVSTVRVKVQLVGDETNVKDESANNFTVKGSITNAQPAGNADANLTEYWRVGQTKNISWTSSPADQGDVTIVYSSDGSTFPEPANQIVNNINSSTSPYAWPIPSAAISETVRFKVYRNLDTSVTNSTPNNIKVYDLGLTYPGALDLKVGGNYTFNWAKTGAFTTPSNEFRIMASKDGAAYSEITNPASRPTGTSWQWANIATSWRSNDVKFKLDWMGDTTDFSIPATPASVTIKPTVDLTAPDGNTTEGAGATLPIIFSHTGTNADSWKVLYSTNGGDAGSGTYPDPGNLITTLTDIAPNTPYQHDWTIPSVSSVLSATVRVKVQLVGDEANVKDESANNFVIKGRITNAAPDGNADPALTEYWRVGQTKSITWGSDPSDQGDVTVVYSKDGGTNFVEPDDVIGTLNSALGTKSWLIPSGAASEQVRFRVYKSTDSAVKDDTANNVRVYYLALNSPGSTELRVGDNYTFNWARVGAFSTPSSEFRLSVSKEGGAFTELTNPATRPTGSSWQWVGIPTAWRSDDIKFRLEWMGDTTDFVVDTAQLTIKPRVDLTAPDGNTTEGVGTQIPIIFTHTGTTGDSWKLRYSTDGGDAGSGTYPAGNVITTLTGIAPGTPYQHDWTIPTITSILSSTVRVKVELVGDEANVKDESANNLAIKGLVTNVQPDGNSDPALTEYWRVGQTKSVTWGSTPSDQGNVVVVYSKDAGANFVEPDDVIGTLNSSLLTKSWLIPSGAVSEQVRFRVYRQADSGVKDDTANNVRIYYMALNSPGATELKVGNNYTFNWAKTGAFSAPSNEFRISISKEGGAYTELTNPASRPIGTSWQWTDIPASWRSDDIKFKLEWMGDTTDFAVETGQVTIKPKVDLTAPDGNTTHGAGTQLPVIFTHTGTTADSWKLLYSTNGGDAGGGTYPDPANLITTLTSIAPGVPYQHDWPIPSLASVLSSTVRVKVALSGDETNTKDESANTFVIKGSLSNLQPAGDPDVDLTEYWRVGQTKNVSWVSSPSDQGDVTLVYSLDGTSFPEPANRIFNNVNSGTSPYPWPIPSAAVSETVKFRIYRNLDTSVVTTTPNNIKVYDLTLTYPGATDLKVGANYTFNWTKSGAFSTPSNEFRITASKDGAAYAEITNPASRPTGSSWQWANIPLSWRSNDVKFKLEWMGDTTDFSVPGTPGSVTIKSNLDLTAPDGNTTEGAGTTIPITFTHSGGTGDSWRIRYSTDGGDQGGGTYPAGNIIDTVLDVASPYTYDWTIPSLASVLSGTVRVKVEFVGDEANVKDESANTFVIKGAILSFQPQGNSDVNLTEYWRVGQTKSITWASHPADQGLVTVVFSTDGGTNFTEPDNVIGTPNSSANSQSWAIPAAAVSEQVRLRTYRQADSGIKGESANNLKVYNLTFTYPGAQDLKVGANYTFNWTKTGLFATPSNEFRIMGSKDGGAYAEITNPASRPTGSSWQWVNIPTAWRSNDVKFQLEWMGDTTDFQIPAAPASVTIKPTVDLTAPDGNTTEGAGTTVPITFTHSGTTGDFWKILYSTDGTTYPDPANVIDTVTSVAPGAPYNYDWTIPSVSSVLTGTARVKVQLVGDEANVKDESANTFVIKGAILSFQPQGNSDVNLTEYWRVGQTKSITWASHPADQGTVTVVFSTDGGLNFTEPANVIGTPNSSANSQSWLIPAGAVSEQVRLRTYRQADSSIKGESANNLKVYDLQFTYPTATELKVGNNYTFSWTKSGLFATPTNEFRIMASKDGGAYTEITPSGSRPTGSSWQWANIPTSWRSNDVKFQLEWMGDTTDFQIPAAPASVTIKPTLNLTAPDGNTTEGAGTTIPVIFTHTGTTADSWKLLYSTNGGDAGSGTYPDPANVITTLTSIAPDVPYQHDWAIPSLTSVLSNTVRVKVQLVGDESNVKDESANNFAIKGSLTGVQPNGNADANLTEYWRVGQTKSVTWASSPSDQGDVKVVYSKDAGSNFVEPDDLIGTLNSSAGSQSWLIPSAAISEQVRFRVYRVADSGVKGDTLNNVKVYQLQLNSPGSTELRVGNNYTFNWSKVGAYTTPSNEFRVSVSKDGAAYSEITNPASRPTGSSWQWTNIPTSLRSNDIKMKLEWMGDTTDFALETGQITIKPKVDLTAPDGNTTEGAGTTIPITFTHTGTTGDSWKLLYSVNGGDAGGGTYPDPGNLIDTVTSVAPGAPYTYDWTIPTLSSMISSTVRVKVELVGDEANVKDESANNFNVKGSILNVQPNGNSDPVLTEYWRVGQTKSATWSSSPSDQGDVKVVYSKDGGSNFIEPDDLINTLNSAIGTQSWLVPSAAISEQVRFRVYRVADSSVKGDTLNNVKVYHLQLNTPTLTEIRIGNNYTFNWSKIGLFAASPNGPSNEFKVYVDKGTGYQEVTSSPLPTGVSWQWANVPASFRSDTVKAKLEWQGDTTDFGVETGTFTVKPKVDLTAPDGNTTEGAGTTIPITFTHTGTTGDSWKLLYSVNGGDAGGGTYPDPANVITTVSGASPVTHNWTIPSVPSILVSTVRVKVQLVGDETNVKDESANNFTVKGAILSIGPDGNADPALTEYWRVGQTKDVSWVSSPSDQGDVRLAYSLDGGNSFPAGQEFATINSALSPFPWAIPAGAQGESVRFRVYRVADSGIKKDTANNIKIYDLALTYPAATQLRIGDDYTFNWTKGGAFSTPSNEFRIMASKEGAAYTELTNPAGRPTGAAWQWSGIPASWRTGDVKFKVEWMGDAADFSVPVSPASVTVKPRVTLTTPNSGTFSVDQQIPVTFSHTGDSGAGGDEWEILYSTNGGDAGGGSYPSPQNLIHTTAAGVSSPYTYNWTIPDAAGIVGNNVRVKVQMKNDAANVKAESSSALTVRGKLVLNAPLAGAVWKVGDTTRTISWTSKQITNIRIDYTLNNGTDGYGNSIVASTGAAGGSFTWSAGIPASAVSDQVKIRIKAIDAADSVSEDFSGLMAIVPRLTLTYPTGGEVLAVGTISSSVARTITWTYSGSIDFVEIFYTKDTTGDTDGDGMPDPPEGTWVSIATGVNAVLPAALEYTWPSVADDITTTARIVLRKKNDSRTKFIAGSYFKIRGNINLDQPDLSVPGGGLSVGADYDIKWTPTGTLPANVKIEYSTNGFADENETSACMGPAGQNGGNWAPGASGQQQTFTWRIPGPADPAVKVRVTQLTDSTVTDKSTNPFEIRGSLFVEVPNGNATAWIPGQTPQIQWHQLGGVANIKVYFYKDSNLDGNPDADDPQLYRVDNGGSTGVGAGVENTTTSLAWPNPDASGNAGVPNKPTAEAYRIRIEDAANSNVKDDSDACFIIKSQITVTNPNSSTGRFVGDPLTVQWTPTGQPGPVTIEYSKNAFADETQVTQVTSGLNITSPPYEYVISGGVPDALAATGPAGQAETVKFRVKSEQANALLVASDVSDSSFSIRGKITIGAPSASYVLSDTWTVPWTRSGSIGSVKVEYFNGTSWSTITTAAAQAGPFPLLLDSANGITVATDAAQVKVSDADRPEVVSTSTAFIVKPYFQITGPAANGTVTYDGVTPYTLTWDKKGSNVTDVKIEYSRNGFTSSTVLFSGSTPNDGTQDWSVPNDLSTSDNDDVGGNTAAYDVQLKISSLPLTDPFANSSVMTGAFKIVGQLGIDAPTGTDKWDAGTNKSVKWTRAGTIEKVRLMYSTTPGGNGDSNTIVTDYDGSLGVAGYSWPIPTTAVTDTAKVRIYDERDLSVTLLSPQFKILPAFTVTSPTSNQRVTVMQNQTVTWDRVGTGTPNTVKLFYSTNGGGAWNQVMTETDGTPNDGILDNDGSFDWAVPDFSGVPSPLPNANAMVRVEWTGDSAAKDESPTFKLVAGYTVVTPNSSADKWDVGALNQPITWTCTSAFVPKVKIEYSIDGGANYDNTIVPEADNSGVSGANRTYQWPVVDDNITSQLRVRVSQPAVSGVQSADADFAGGAGDVSNANSKIKMAVTNVRINPDPSNNELKVYNVTAGNPNDVEQPNTYTVSWSKSGTGATTTNVDIFYSKNNFSTAGIEIANDVVNNGSFAWQVPDDVVNSANVKLRVQSWTDLDAKGDSSSSYKVRGDYVIDSPTAGASFKIFDAVQNPNTHNITWRTLGGAGSTMGTVNVIAYSTTSNDQYFRDGSNNVYTVPDPLGTPTGQPYNPLVISTGYTNNPNASTTYVWSVPDKASTTVVVRLVNPNDAAIYKDSPVFKVEGSFTLTNPDPNTAGQTFVVGDPLTLNWNKTGQSITKVKVSISKNAGGAWTPIIENEEGTANDGVITNDGTFDWVIPDFLPGSSACILKLEDTTPGSTVSFVTPAPNAFRIRGGLTFTSPTGAGVRWVVNENRDIQWNTSGSITNVNVYYSKDNFTGWISGPAPDPLPAGVFPIVTNLTNSIGANTRVWDVPNDLSTTVKLRLADTSDTAVFSDSTQFEVGRYNITFEVRDLLSNNHLGGLTVTATHSGVGAYNWSGSYGSPFTKPVEATKSGQTWSVTFVKQGYADGSASFTADTTLGDQTIPTIFMETNVVHVWESVTDIAYNSSNDSATVSSTLRRDGIKVQGATSININVYDGLTLVKNFTQASAPDANGFYNFTWAAPTLLDSTKVYNVLTAITNATGGIITTPRTLTITLQATVQTAKNTIDTKLDKKLSEVEGAILGPMNTKLDEQKTIIEDEMAEGKAAIETAASNMEATITQKMNEFTGQVASSIISLEDAAERSQTATENLEDAASKSQAAAKALEQVSKQYAGRLLLPPGALIGETIVLRYRGGAGLFPLVTVRAEKNGTESEVVKNGAMKESTEKPGLYEYSMKVDINSFEPGKTANVFVQTEVMKDLTTGAPVFNLESGALAIIGVTLDTLQGLIASQGGQKALVQETLSAVQAIKGNLATGGDIGRSLSLLSERLNRLPKEITGSQDAGNRQVQNTLKETAQFIRTLAGEQTGVSLSQMMSDSVQKGLDEAPTVQKMRKAVDQVKNATELTQILMEKKLGGVDEPVVHMMVE